MRKINTKAGTLYIEELDERREELERIKIFDSDKRYLDYFSYDTFIDDEDNLDIDLYEDILNNLKDCVSIEEIMDYIVLGYYFIGDKESTRSYLIENEYIEESCWDITECEYVNHIGNEYVVVEEC